MGGLDSHSTLKESLGFRHEKWHLSAKYCTDFDGTTTQSPIACARQNKAKLTTRIIIDCRNHGMWWLQGGSWAVDECVFSSTGAWWCNTMLETNNDSFLADVLTTLICVDMNRRKSNHLRAWRNKGTSLRMSTRWEKRYDWWSSQIATHHFFCLNVSRSSEPEHLAWWRKAPTRNSVESMRLRL